jgi:hypothetical protein
LVGAGAGGLVATAGPVLAENPLPINWTVSDNFRGPLGDDVPLRFGQHDFSETDQGFGRFHIEDGHGVVVPELIQETLSTCTSPVPRPDGRVECAGEEMVVIYQPTVDPRPAIRRRPAVRHHHGILRPALPG